MGHVKNIVYNGQAILTSDFRELCEVADYNIKRIELLLKMTGYEFDPDCHSSLTATIDQVYISGLH